eukprot:Pgem_evm1s11108
MRERNFDSCCSQNHFKIDENGVVSTRGDGPKKCDRAFLGGSGKRVITKISAGAFSEMPNVRFLCITNNKHLKEIEEGAFDNLSNLHI